MKTVTGSLKSSLASKIADDLRLNIILGILEEGSLLNEMALAEKYGVSRGPIRQAIQLLSLEGIVETQPNGRSKILGFRINELQDYFNLRLFIESEAIKKIMQQPDDDDYHKWLDHMESLLNKSIPTYTGIIVRDNNYDEQDLAFHCAIVERAGSQISNQVWKTLSNLALSIAQLHKMYYSEKYVHETNITIACHQRLLDGLRKRDLDYVLTELNAHMQHGIMTLTHTWEKAREEVINHSIE